MGSGGSKSASPAPQRGEPGIIDKQRSLEWKYNAIIDERNKLRDTAHRFFKVYKEVDEPGWTNRVKNEQIRAELREEQLRLQSVLRKTYQQAQIMQKNIETQNESINLNRKFLRNMNTKDIEMNRELALINEKINKEKSTISSRYSYLSRHRRAIIAGRVLTVLTLITILYFTVSKMDF